MDVEQEKVFCKWDLIIILYLPINMRTPKYNRIPKITSYSFIYIKGTTGDLET